MAEDNGEEGSSNIIRAMYSDLCMIQDVAEIQVHKELFALSSFAFALGLTHIL